MKFFRTHITRSFNLAILLLGMALYLVKPIQEKAKPDAFTTWLQSSLKSANNADVLDQIKGLDSQKGELETIIRKASALVKANADDFKFPLNSDSQDEDEVFKVLLKEWKASQQASTGMGKAVIIKQAQPLSLLPIDALAFHGKSLFTQQSIYSKGLGYTITPEATTYLNYQRAPHSSGKAIGAP